MGRISPGHAWRLYFFCVVLVSAGSTLAYQMQDLQLPPIVFVPGMGASPIDLKVAKNNVLPPVCQPRDCPDCQPQYDKWYTLQMWEPKHTWFFTRDCIALYLTLHRGPDGKYSGPFGVSYRTPYWGSIAGVMGMDKDSHYAHWVDTYLHTYGYTDRENIFGAPYDFRFAITTLQEDGYFTRLKALLEHSFDRNKLPAVMMGHSIGPPIIYSFLRAMPRAWKDKYVGAFISVAGGPAGQISSLGDVTFGAERPVIFPQDPARNAAVLRTWESMAWTLPGGNFPGHDEIIAEVPTGRYAASNLSLFLENAGFRDLAENYKRVNHIAKDMWISPDVNTYCFNGVGVETVVAYVWNTTDVTRPPASHRSANGDGLNSESRSSLCALWGKNMPKQYEFRLQQFHRNHMDIISADEVFAATFNITVARAKLIQHYPYFGNSVKLNTAEPDGTT